MIIKRDFIYTPNGQNRRLHIYLPDSYYQSDERYPVMYFFDGHNLYYDEDATYGKSWGLKDYLDQWSKNMIIVGMECAHGPGERLGEYSPYSAKTGFMKGVEPTGDATFRWIVEDLKPVIDRDYRTYTNRQCTGIAGSSMGGLMALYGIVRYNEWFSKGACISSAVGFCMPQMNRELKAYPIDPDTRAFLSWGTREAYGVTDHEHEDFTSTTSKNNRKLAAALEKQGAAVEICCQVGGNHCEADWENQVPMFMDFLWMR